MSDERLFVQLLDEVTLTRDSVAVLLFALDVVGEADVEPAGGGQGEAGHPAPQHEAVA